ncbi:hypothetical protein [Alicyclobacillus sendaiensis]|uniref:hypothetical protein n=1 Tax=Alicyclobacillus sendaiensis TaxID=192387 RepID=UPI0026F47E50|nr:hypothetical protein [Alicyclobacillus sendaiensis]
MSLFNVNNGDTGGNWLWQQIIDAINGNNDIGAFTAFRQISPPGAPTVAVNSVSGNLTGNYQYAVAFLTGYWKGPVGSGTLYIQGNTGGGTPSAVVSPNSQQVNVSNIPIGPTGVVARAIYRTKANGSTFYLLTQINDNTTTSMTDNIPDSQLGSVMPTTNTTGTMFVGNGGGLYNVTPNTASSSAIGGLMLPPSAGTPSNPVAVYRAVSVKDMTLTSTSATTVLSYTPAATGQFKVSGYLRVANAATSVTVTLTYTSPSGSQSRTLVPTYTLATGDYTIPARTFEATTAGPITLSVTAGTANNVTVSAVLEAV